MFRRAMTIVCLLFLAPLALGANPIRALLIEDRLEEALGVCRQFEVLAGYDQDILLACAWVYYRLDKSQSADAILARVKRSATLPEFQILNAYSKIKSNQLDTAIAILENVAKQNRGSPIATLAEETKAEAFEARGQLDTAAFIYKQVLSADPHRARPNWGLGRYYLSKGDTRRAVDHLTETTKLWPKHMGSRFNLGVLFLSQDDTAMAARWLSECYNLNRTDTGVLEQLGNLFEKKGNIREALKHWQIAIDLGSKSPLPREKTNQYLAQTIDTLLGEKKFNEALLKIEALPAELKKDPKVMLWRGVIHRNLGDFKKASGELLAFSQNDPENPLVLRELGICYVNLGLATQAFESFSKAVERDPNDGYNHAWFAYILESKGELSKAREHWNVAIGKLKDANELERAVRRVTAIEKKLREKKR
ncbi:MAG: tetratricopeptide repeat protein [Deltaproteobacteria bacterium]|nr:tetratricopeptide repeat protein [Deltaproteobacteria bacterium]